MAETVILPKWGLTMDEGTVRTWLKQEGDVVSEGETLVEVETDKITNELVAPINGILARILVESDATVEVGTPLALIAATPEEAAQLRQG